MNQDFWKKLEEKLRKMEMRGMLLPLRKISREMSMQKLER